MALRGGRGKKEMRKSSYYVLFLGAQECRGIRGEEYVRPVVRYFIEQEKEMEPMKVTLQVSGKGLKILQSCGNGESAKHFIPHHAITCVVQEPEPNADIVSAILLIYNPITKCPVHVHSYRCDSAETAEILRYQLAQLIEREDNQKKLQEIESRLEAKGLLPSNGSRAGSDGRSTRDSESSGSWDREHSRGRERIANLYDSLAAELREKLGKRIGETPLLLPPRDYDTISRQQGRLEGIDERRSRQANIVGMGGRVAKRTAQTRDDSSGKSSGIGSDDASSPLHDHARSSSDEEWEVQGEPRPFTEDSLFLVQPQWNEKQNRKDDAALLHKQVIQRHSSPPRDPRWSPPHLRKRHPEERQRSPSPSSPRQSFAAAREKFRLMEKKQAEEKKQKSELKRQPSRAKDDTNWPKSDKDTGYISKDGFGTRDTGYGSKSARSRDLSPSYRVTPRETDISPARVNKSKKEDRVDKERYRNEFSRRKSFSKDLSHKINTNNNNNNNNGSCSSSSCSSIDVAYHRRYRSSDALHNNCMSSKGYKQTQPQLLPKNKSFDQLDNRRRHEEVRRNQSLDELEFERRASNYDARMRAYPRAAMYHSQEEVNVRKDRRKDEYDRRNAGVTHQAINRHVNKDRLKRHSTCYNELDSTVRYPGLDKDSARLHHHSLQHLPIARGPIGGPAGPVGPGTRSSYENLGSRPPYESSGTRPPYEGSGTRPPYESSGIRPPYESSGTRPPYESSGTRPPYESSGTRPLYESSGARVPYESSGTRLPYENPGTRPPYESSGMRPAYERSQSEIPSSHWQHRSAFGRYSYAEPSSYHRAHHIGVAGGY